MQEYKVTFDELQYKSVEGNWVHEMHLGIGDDIVAIAGDTSDDDLEGPRLYGMSRVSGHGHGYMSEVTVEGTLYGTQLKMQENWTLGDGNVVEFADKCSRLLSF
jgi:hypothetical protein